MNLYTIKEVELHLKEAHQIDLRMPPASFGKYPRKWATIPRLEKTSRRSKSAPRQGGPSGHDEDKWATRMRWLNWLHPNDRVTLWRIISGEKQNRIAAEFCTTPKQMTLWKQKALHTIADHLNSGHIPECAYERQLVGVSVLERVEACYTKITLEIGGNKSAKLQA